jgi:hypothetical protein
VVFATLSLLVSCAESKPHWEYTASPSTERIYYASEDNYRGIDLEVMRSRSGDRMYASIHSSPVHTESPRISIGSEDEKLEYESYRFEGGQRFLLPEEAVEKIFSLLSQSKPVTLQIGRYEQVITSSGFGKVYKKYRKNKA